MEAFALNAEMSGAELNRPEPSLSSDGCLFSPATRRPILLHNTVEVCIFPEVPLREMSASALDCEILINAVHLRPA
jgi:hypothetical protein